MGKYRIELGIRPGDTISSHIYSSSGICIKELDWAKHAINSNGEYLNHLCFADDIVIAAERLNLS